MSAQPVPVEKFAPLTWRVADKVYHAINTVGIETDLGRPAVFTIRPAWGIDLGFTVADSSEALLMEERPDPFDSLAAAQAWCARQQAAIAAVLASDVAALSQAIALRSAQKLVDDVAGELKGTACGALLMRVAGELEQAIDWIGGRHD